MGDASTPRKNRLSIWLHERFAQSNRESAGFRLPNLAGGAVLLGLGAATLIAAMQLLGDGKDMTAALITALVLACASLFWKARTLQLRTLQRDAAGTALSESEARLRLAHSAAKIATLDWDIAGEKALWSSNFVDVFGVPGGVRTGKSVYEQFLALVHPEDRARVDALHLRLLTSGGGPFSYDFRILAPSGAVRWMASRGEVACDIKGRPRRLLASIFDVSEQRAKEETMRRTHSLIELANEAGEIGVWSSDLVLRRGVWDERARRIFDWRSDDEGVDFDAFSSMVHPADMERVRTAITQALKSGETFSFETRILRRDRVLRWIAIRGRADRDAYADRSTTMTGIVQDITERREREANLHAILRELSHRSKNLLAVIQSMARQSGSSATSLADFQLKFAGRLQALAASQDLLVASDWRSASIAEIAHSQISYFLEPSIGRVAISGPAVRLAPAAAQNIALAFHELAANAMKFGALASPKGAIEISWTLNGDANSERTLQVVWKESGGRAPTPPHMRGFGSAVLATIVAQTLEGASTTRFDPAGLIWTLDIPDRFVISQSD